MFYNFAWTYLVTLTPRKITIRLPNWVVEISSTPTGYHTKCCLCNKWSKFSFLSSSRPTRTGQTAGGFSRNLASPESIPVNDLKSGSDSGVNWLKRVSAHYKGKGAKGSAHPNPVTSWNEPPTRKECEGEFMMNRWGDAGTLLAVRLALRLNTVAIFGFNSMTWKLCHSA